MLRVNLSCSWKVSLWYAFPWFLSCQTYSLNCTDGLSSSSFTASPSKLYLQYIVGTAGTCNQLWNIEFHTEYSKYNAAREGEPWCWALSKHIHTIKHSLDLVLELWGLDQAWAGCSTFETCSQRADRSRFPPQCLSRSLQGWFCSPVPKDNSDGGI